jgi:hypothetical protein
MGQSTKRVRAASRAGEGEQGPHAAGLPKQAFVAEVARLIESIEDDDGPRAAYAALQARLRDLRERGEAVPTELEHLERKLVLDCCAMSQGR